MPSTTQPTRQSVPGPSSGNRELQMQPSKDLLTYVQAYAREKPDVAALWCFGLGFVLGWKLKIW